MSGENGCGVNTTCIGSLKNENEEKLASKLHYVCSIMSRICELHLSQDNSSLFLIMHIVKSIIDRKACHLSKQSYNLPYVIYYAIIKLVE